MAATVLQFRTSLVLSNFQRMRHSQRMMRARVNSVEFGNSQIFYWYQSKIALRGSIPFDLCRWRRAALTGRSCMHSRRHSCPPLHLSFRGLLLKLTPSGASSICNPAIHCALCVAPPHTTSCRDCVAHASSFEGLPLFMLRVCSLWRRCLFYARFFSFRKKKVRTHKEREEGEEREER